MSAAAEQIARQVIHPKVKGSRRALLDTIATLIPEGQTMTAPIGDDDLAILISYDERTLRRARKVLTGHRIIGVRGGQGRMASYELLTESGGAARLLPMLGAAKPPRAAPPRATPLLDEPLVDVMAEDSVPADLRAYTVGQNARSWVLYFGHFVRSWRRYFGHFGHFVRSWSGFRAYTVGRFVRSTRMDVGVDVSRARDHVQQLKTRTTTAAQRTDGRPRPALPCRWHGTVHAWCEFRMHVPMTLHREELRHLACGPAETAADLEARQFAVYAEEAASIPDDAPISDPNEFAFWKRVLQARRRRDVERAPPTSPRPTMPPDDLYARERWTQRRARLLGDRAKHSG